MWCLCSAERDSDVSPALEKILTGQWKPSAFIRLKMSRRNNCKQGTSVLMRAPRQFVYCGERSPDPGAEAIHGRNYLEVLSVAPCSSCWLSPAHLRVFGAP